MNIPQDILKEQPAVVREMSVFWTEYMENNLSFGLNDSDIHTTSHCERVLLYSLILGYKIFGNREICLEILSHASIFHDTRRQDDYLDKGHGARAAGYYRSFCLEHDMVFHKDAFNLMKYHDQDDSLGLKIISENSELESSDSILLYKIFKDADALDRYRLGPWGLNPDFLRNKESVRLMEFAKKLVELTVDKDYLEQIMLKTKNFKDRISKGV